MFEGVEWETLFFFIGLFMMIKGIENLDIIKFIGDKMIAITEGHFGGAVLSTMWISALFTSVIGNVANAATFSKIINIMTPSFAGVAGVKALLVGFIIWFLFRWKFKFTWFRNKCCGSWSC